MADARAGLQDLLTAVMSRAEKRRYHDSPWFGRLKELKALWAEDLRKLRSEVPMGIPNLVSIMRERLPKDAIVTLSAGLPQEILLAAVGRLQAGDLHQLRRVLDDGVRAPGGDWGKARQARDQRGRGRRGRVVHDEQR